jgi:hypothetical protein
VVNVTGAFGGFGQGQVRVRFQGSGWLYPQIMGPTMASVVVPQDAENGLCEVEVNGRRVFGTNCIVEKGQVRVGQKSHAGRDTRSWNWAGGELVKVQGLGAVTLGPPPGGITGGLIAPSDPRHPNYKAPSPLKPYLPIMKVVGAVAAGVAFYGGYSGNKTVRNIGLASLVAIIPLQLSAER